MANYDFLRKIPLFSALPDDDLASLCQIVREMELPAGQVLFEEGSIGDMAYIIESGEVEIEGKSHVAPGPRPAASCR